MTAIDFHKLAKTELHCHLDGSLSLKTIRHLADLAQIELPEDDEELKHHVTNLSNSILFRHQMVSRQLSCWKN